MTPQGRISTFLLITPLVLAGCMGDTRVTGTIAQAPTALPVTEEIPTTSATCAKPGAHAVPKLLRLSNYEYQQVLSDLIGAEVSGEHFIRWTPIAQVYGFDTMSESRIDGQALQEQLQTSETLTKLVLGSKDLMKACPAPTAPPAPACVVKATYNPTTDFSSTQGQGCWSYRDSANGLLEFDTANARWRNVQDPGTLIWATGGHPGAALDSVRRWIAPVDGSISMTGAFRDVDPGGGDGVTVAIQRVGKDLWRRVIANASADTFDIKVTVKRGEAIDFIVNRTGNPSYDTTALDAAITFTQAPLTAGWNWENCVKPVTTRLASHAFRRPLRPEELAGYQQLFDASMVEAVKADMPSPFYESLTTVIQATLLSPNLMFKPELVPGGLDPAEKDFGTASKLSLYFLGSVADDELWGLAEAGKLSDPKVVEQQAQRLLEQYPDRFATNFGGQWLDFRRAQTGKSEPLMASMETESFEVFKEVLSTGLLPQQLIKPGFTFVDQPLATHYGLPFTADTMPFHKVATPARGGLLSQGAFLTRTANGSEFRRVIHRGLWSLTRVLCQSLPRLDAATLEEINLSVGKIDRTLPLSDQMALHRDSSSRCGACHSQMDPIGLALEKYDEKGLYRDTYPNGTPIVNEFAFNGAKVRTPEELANVIEQSPEYRECVATKLLTYAMNRGPVDEELCTAKTLATPEDGTRPSLKTMTVEAILTSLQLTEVAP
jgi:hypothetical protein